VNAAAKVSTQPDSRSYTPKHLAEKILTSRSALEGERKQVTVLFADVKGSMDLAEQVDPEEWHKILDGFFKILTDGVHRFEGPVNQYTGDGIMALFGAPIAHENHAQRACYSALYLRDALKRYADELRRTQGLSLSTRIGINSGEVVVGKIGDDLRMDYTAQGQTVGLAAPMEQLAEPGSAYLTEYTAKLVSGFLQLRDLGPFELKGVSAPVRVFELEGVGALTPRSKSPARAAFLASLAVKARPLLWKPRSLGRSTGARRWSVSSASQASGRAVSASSFSSVVGRAGSRSSRRMVSHTARRFRGRFESPCRSSRFPPDFVVKDRTFVENPRATVLE
jgi:class 3 adenylate cyclase